jgi:adenylyltransferase/sulfurtransferase
MLDQSFTTTLAHFLCKSFRTTMKDRLLMYDSLNCSFINIKKPPKSAKCSVCGESPTITSMKDSWNATQMCRGPNVATTTIASLSVQPTLAKGFHISCKEYAMIHKRREPHVLLDVRVPRQFEMCSLEGAVNIPLANLPQELDRVAQLSQGSKPVYCLCRRGIFSVEATRILSQATKSHPDIWSPKNILGGLHAWSEQVDSSFPKY